MSGSTARLSSALLVADMNDFLTPSQACVLPMDGGAIAEPAGSVLTPIVPRSLAQRAEPSANDTPAPAKKATITLSDCLSCSGCVTTAETVLLSSASVLKLRSDILDAPTGARRGRFAVAALSQQSVSSFAVRFGLGLETCARRLAHFFTAELGFDAVVDMALARRVAHAEAAAEFVRRFRAGAAPVVCSACPGWVTYAEKTQDAAVLDAVSRVRSPQAVLGALAQRVLAPEDGRRVWLATVMMCHDKKIEASRPEFVDAGGEREVDCVLTTGEVFDLLEEFGYDLSTASEAELDPRFSVLDGQAGFGMAVGSGSGGYADFVLRYAAQELLGVTLPERKLEMEKASRSGDMQSIVVASADGSKQLRFALAYGFRSLQSILRKMRRGECAYDYIELMACPGGCNNGGGQLPLVVPDGIKTDDARAMKSANAALLGKVEDVYFSAPKVSAQASGKNVEELMESVSDGPVGSAAAMKALHTTIVSRKTSSVGSLVW